MAINKRRLQYIQLSVTTSELRAAIKTPCQRQNCSEHLAPAPHGEETQRFLNARSAHRPCQLPRPLPGRGGNGGRGAPRQQPRLSPEGQAVGAAPCPCPDPRSPIPHSLFPIPDPRSPHAPWRARPFPAPRCRSLSAPGGRGNPGARKSRPRLLGNGLAAPKAIDNTLPVKALGKMQKILRLKVLESVALRFLLTNILAERDRRCSRCLKGKKKKNKKRS